MDLKTVIEVSDHLLKEGYVDAVREIFDRVLRTPVKDEPAVASAERYGRA
ncbi:hypothetical protein MOC12_20845 [Bacillus spizizenii]|nr:hypothetical protein [Bacillus spizizenii]